MFILLAFVGWGVAEGQMATGRTPVSDTEAPLEEVQRVLGIINEVQSNFSFEADVDAIKCGGGCGANCSKSHCFIQCTNSRPVCFCDAFGYAFCGCYAHCSGSQAGATGEGSSTMGIESGEAEAPKVKITPTANGVRVESQEEVALRVWDVSGRLMYSGEVRGVKFVPLKRGVFFVKAGRELKKILIR